MADKVEDFSAALLAANRAPHAAGKAGSKAMASWGKKGKKHPKKPGWKKP